MALSKHQVIIVSVVVSVIVVSAVAVVLWLVLKGSSEASSSPSPNLVLVGVALATDNEVAGKIPLSKILGGIDFFWDWLPEYDVAIYDEEEVSVYKKYVPMNWGEASTPDARLLAYLERAKSEIKYVFSWNEPDMAGSIMNGEHQATSDGFWIDSTVFPYGNATKNGVNSVAAAMAGKTAYPGLANILGTNVTAYKNIVSDITVASPVMAQNADISRGCAGYTDLTGSDTAGCEVSTGGNLRDLTELYTNGNVISSTKVATPCGFNLSTPDLATECKSTFSSSFNGTALYVDAGNCKTGCGYNGDGNCFCNGWLKLMKELAASDNTWWANIKIINIHGYARDPHLIKLKIFEYMTVFKDDLVVRDSKGIVTKQGKEIWITEVACIYRPSDVSSIGTVAFSAQFLENLMWKDTTATACTESYDTYNPPKTLPGLKTNDTFLFNGRTASWYEHGFGALSWFSANSFAGFAVDCTDPTGFEATQNSNIFTNGEPNKIFEVLTQTGP